MLSNNSVNIIHNVPGRLRIMIKGLKDNCEAKNWCASLLKNKPGIIKNSINIYRGTILIQYNSRVISWKEIVSSYECSNGSELVAVSSEIMAKDRSNPLVSKALPYLFFGAIAIQSLKHNNYKTANLHKSVLYSLTSFYAYSQLVEGITAFAKRHIIDNRILSSIGALLALRANNVFAAISLVIFSSLCSSKEDLIVNNQNIKGSKILPLVPVVGSSLSYLVYRNIPRTVAVISAGTPFALEYAKSLPIKKLCRKGVEQGYYVKNINSLDAIAQANYIIFTDTSFIYDKIHKVEEVILLDKDISYKNITESHILSLVGGAYIKQAPSSIRTAILQKNLELNLPIIDLDIVSSKGKILSCHVEGNEILIGKKEEIQNKAKITKSVLTNLWRLHHLQRKTILIAVNGKVIALVALKDISSSQCRTFIEKIRSQGMKIGLVSTRGEDIELPLRNLGLDPLITNASNEEQLKIIKDIQQEKGKVIIAGSCSSDVELFKRFDMGMCLSSAPESLVNEADIIIDKNRKENIADLLFAGNVAQEIISQNYKVVATLSIIGTSLGISGRLLPAASLIFPMAAGVFVIANSNRINKMKYG